MVLSSNEQREDDMITIANLRAILDAHSHLPGDTPIAICSSASNDDFSWSVYRAASEVAVADMTPVRRIDTSPNEGWKIAGSLMNIDDVDFELRGRDVLVIS